MAAPRNPSMSGRNGGGGGRLVSPPPAPAPPRCGGGPGPPPPPPPPLPPPPPSAPPQGGPPPPARPTPHCYVALARSARTKVSQPWRSSTLPCTRSRKVRCSCFVTSPARPIPTLIRSTLRTGVTSDAVPVRKISSAV